MDFIFDTMAYVLFEILGEGFVSLFTSFIPSRKISIKAYRVLFIMGLVVSIVLFVGLIYGVILLVESNARSVLGWMLLALAIIYVITAVIFKFVNKE